MRIRTILVAAAAPLALGGVLLTATAASAAPNGATGTITCTDATNSNPLDGTAINANLDVPAGQTCRLMWAEVTGNVSVEGTLVAAYVTFDRNVGVNGGSLSLFNGGSHIKGNLSVTGSSGYWDGGPYTSLGDYNDAGASQVDGNFSFIGNSGRLYVGGPLDVSRNFTYASNTGPAPDLSGLHVLGSQSMS
jgi:hypothetical protein